MRINDTTINNLPELITALSQNLEEFRKPVWFRGHSKNEWKLNPLLFRGSGFSAPRKEINLIKKFKQDATLLTNPIPSQLYEWLFIMRHYGVPTRLLDWTESPLVGAYFAVNEFPEEDGVLWALSPLDLNKEGGRELDDSENLPSFGEDTEMDSYTPEKYSQDTMSKLLPIAFIAPRNTQRMQVQLSVFTIFHRDSSLGLTPQLAVE